MKKPLDSSDQRQHTGSTTLRLARPLRWVGEAGRCLLGLLASYADYLSRISWARFFVLGILLLCLAGALLGGLKVVMVGNEVDDGPAAPVKVAIEIDADGEVDVQIGPARAAATSGPTNALHLAPLESLPLPGPGTSVEIRDRIGDINRAIAQRNDQLEQTQRRTDRLIADIGRAVEQTIDESLEKSRPTSIERSDPADLGMPLVTAFIIFSALLKMIGGDLQRAVARAGHAEAQAGDQALRRQVAEARLQVLQAQVEPHFLFNTLASVEHLIETDPPRAAVMLRNLSQYLRIALPQMRDQATTTLGREVDLVRAYLEILRFRMENRLRYTLDVPLGLRSAAFPPMMLQTLMENSIRHGLEPKLEGGEIRLVASVIDGELAVCVEDTGMGLGRSLTPGTGFGLANIRERLSALHGDAARLVLEALPEGGTRAVLVVPYRVNRAAAAGAIVESPATEVPSRAAEALKPSRAA